MASQRQEPSNEVAQPNAMSIGGGTSVERKLSHLKTLATLRLAQKAFYPGKIPFPLLRIDTSYKFPEMIEFRDQYAKTIGAELIVHKNQGPAAGDRFFDLSEINLPAGDPEAALEHVLTSTKSLRISGEDGNPRKVI